MKRLGVAVAILAFVLAAPVGVLYVAVTPNEIPEEGPADPIIGVRRSVLACLRYVGIVDGPAWFTGWYLPTVGGTRTWKEEPDGEDIPTSKMEIEREPVYRGIFWWFGNRITYRMTDFTDERREWQ